MVVLHSSLDTIWSLIHLVRLLDKIRLIIVEDNRWERCPSLSRLLLQLLSPSRIIYYRDYSRVVNVECSTIDETLNLESDMLSVTEVSLQVIISFLKLLNLSESPSKFSLGVVVDPLLLLDLFFGPSSFGRDLHQVRGVALRNYGSQIQERLEIECNEILEFYIRMKCLPDTD